MTDTTKVLIGIGVVAGGYLIYKQMGKARALGKTPSYTDEQPATGQTKAGTWDKIQSGIDSGQKLGNAAKDLWDLINGKG